MSEWAQNLDTYNDWEPPDPPMDESVTLRCANPKCEMFWEPSKLEPVGETWHPEVFFEYQGVEPHVGVVSLYVDDAWECAECGEEGEEV